MRPIELTLNGTRVRTTVEPHETLLGVLRQRLAATEVKSGCERGNCGACAVLVDGRAINSCLALAVQADGRAVTTVRGLGTPEANKIWLAELEKFFFGEGAKPPEGYVAPEKKG